ncbi:uncharacterized protein BN594_00189 [Bacteroides uniformis CAG:3]|nr:uncharacterized protein BN594_00189 [Bacteroides uniformis CAG:3]
MDKAGIFCTSNTDISLQKVHHAFFTGNHVAHCFRFIREKAFIRTFQLHLTCHITFEFDAGTEFHRGHLDRLRTYFFLIHHRMGTLQRGAEEAKSLYLHRIALCQPVSKRSGDGLHNTHNHGVGHMFFTKNPFHELFTRNGSLGTDTGMQRLRFLAFGDGRFIKVIISTHKII